MKPMIKTRNVMSGLKPHPWIKNFQQLATSPKREMALSVVNAALDAVDTAQVMASALAPDGDDLIVKDQRFDLSRFQRIYVAGIGKAAHKAAAALEGLLGTRLAGGVVIGTGEVAASLRLQTYAGTHPLPSAANVDATRQLVELSQRLTELDLVLVVVSGGGSAMLCWPESECEQSRRLYQDFLGAGGSILELNTVRKHLSAVKGGGLAKMLYPARVVGLVFSDVPGDNFEAVASGPTYRDATTRADAEQILQNHQISGYQLNETPKDWACFERVTNIPLVSNQTALTAMAARGRALGLESMILGDRFYDPVDEVAAKIILEGRKFRAGGLVVAGGEPRLKVAAHAGRGGRNQHLTLHALKSMQDNQVFISLGSDGHDNGDVAGAIADGETAAKASRLGLDPAAYLERFDAGTFFEKTGDAIITGPTESNVSDLMLLLTWPD
jgi:glycerate-2-kinase